MKRLFKIFWKKELHFWKRIIGIKAKTNFVIFFFAALMLGLCHYAFAFMHFMFELVMMVFSKATFDLNMSKLEKQLVN